MSKEKAHKFILDKELNNQKRNSKYRIIYGTITLIIIIFIVVIIYLTLGDMFETSSNVIVDNINIHEYISSMGNDENPENFEAVMTSKWTFKDCYKESVDAYVENSVNNANDFYFTVTLKDNPDTILYSSKKLKKGDCDDSITLNHKLKAGTYNAILTYYLLNDDGDCISTIPMGLEIVILK